MVRVKRGTTSNKTRKNVLKQVKGYRFNRSNKEREARVAIAHAGNHAFAHRRKKKGDFRRLFTVRMNAALRPLGHSYSRFIDMLTKKDVELNRKVLSEIAVDSPESFTRIVKEVAGSVTAVATPEPAKAAPEAKSAAASSEADDLTKIEGIGPKIKSIFTEAGIATFADLAKADIEKLRSLLEENKLAQHDPTTWSEQSEMANAGQWDELKKWQDELDGGK